MRAIMFFLLLAFCFLSWGTPPAMAIPTFQKAFLKQYVDEKKDPDFAAKVKEARCWVCHQYDPENPKKKKKRNRYGKELAKLLDRKKDKKNKEKIIKSLKKVAAMHIDSNDEKSPTYGDLIKQGKLPGGKYVNPKKPAENKAQ